MGIRHVRRRVEITQEQSLCGTTAVTGAAGVAGANDDCMNSVGMKYHSSNLHFEWQREASRATGNHFHISVAASSK